MVERFREKLSTEKLKDRLERMLSDMERAVDAAAPTARSPRGSATVARAAPKLRPEGPPK
jgi:ATP-dependent Lhr-like helicase